MEVLGYIMSYIYDLYLYSRSKIHCQVINHQILVKKKNYFCLFTIYM